MVPDPELTERISSLVGGPASSFEGVQGGYTDAARWTFRANRQRYFVKVGTTAWTSEQLNREIAAYDTLHGVFMPARIAAYVSGFFAARAGLPNIENAPRVRTAQRQQLGPALSWAARALGLRPPD